MISGERGKQILFYYRELNIYNNNSNKTENNAWSQSKLY